MNRARDLADECADVLSWLDGNHPDGAPGSDAEAVRVAAEQLRAALVAYHAPQRQEQQLALPLD